MLILKRLIITSFVLVTIPTATLLSGFTARRTVDTKTLAIDTITEKNNFEVQQSPFKLIARKITIHIKKHKKHRNVKHNETFNTYDPEAVAGEEIAMAESGDSYTAQNGRYYGKYQLDISYLHGDLSPANQERTFIQYCDTRYGSVENALAFRRVHNWY